MNKKYNNIKKFVLKMDGIEFTSETLRGGTKDLFSEPFSFNIILNEWIDYIKSNPDGVVAFYIHIPYCSELCSFCNYNTSKPDYIEQVDNYVNNLVSIIDYIGDNIKGFEFKVLYIGGGTPSILTEKHLKKLFTSLKNNIIVSDLGEKTFESQPSSMTLGKIKILSEYGINRVSMGVQTLDDNVLNISNRLYQDYEIIKEVVDNLYDNGIKWIGLDMLIGLEGEDEEIFLDSFSKMLDLNISEICMYWLTPTEKYLKKLNTTFKDFEIRLNARIYSIYNSINNNKKLTRKYKHTNMDVNRRHAWVFHKNNEGSKVKYYYGDLLDLSVIGIGQGAYSRIYGRMSYRNLFFEHGKFDPNIKVSEGVYIVKNDENILHCFSLVRDYGFIDLDLLEEKYNFYIFKIYKNELEYLIKIKNIELRGRHLYFLGDTDKKISSLLMFLSDLDLIKRFVLTSLIKDNVIEIYIKRKTLKLYFTKDSFFIINDTLNLTKEEFRKYTILYDFIKKIHLSFTSSGREMDNKTILLFLKILIKYKDNFGIFNLKRIEYKN